MIARIVLHWAADAQRDTTQPMPSTNADRQTHLAEPTQGDCYRTEEGRQEDGGKDEDLQRDLILAHVRSLHTTNNVFINDDPGHSTQRQGTGRGRQCLGRAATLKPIGAYGRENLIAEKKFQQCARAPASAPRWP